MAVLPESGRIAMAKGIMEQNIFLAWGTGGEDWGEEPPLESLDASALANEVGRKSLYRAMYVEPDDEGEIVLSYGRFAVSQTPTRHIYLHFEFDYTDGGTSVIREIGIFVGCMLKEGLPAGQTYFLSEDFSDPGVLFVVSHLEKKKERSPVNRGGFEIVISI